jgi:hypothetical protein
MSLNLSFSPASAFRAYSRPTRPAHPMRPTPSAKNYVSNGYVMNNNGYLANPSRSAQVAANNAGALTRSEAASMGLPLGGRR